MHLLSTAPGSITDGEEAVDLDQSPGDLVILTVADSELACLAKAAAQLDDDGPTVRLANLLALKHPYSVDLYVDKIIQHARFICVILLGGKSYWPYGVDEIAAAGRRQGIPFAAISGSGDADPALEICSTLPAADCARLNAYIREGGVTNALSFLQSAAQYAGLPSAEPAPLVHLPDCGHYAPSAMGETHVGPSTSPDHRPTALFTFYRALHAAGTTDAVDAMIDGLSAAGFRVLPVFIRSLRDPSSIALLSDIITAHTPSVILNATSFAASSTTQPRQAAVLERANCPILQVAFAAEQEQDWQSSARGLGTRDLAMNVAMPEVDGRIFTRAVAFKASAAFDERTQCAIIAPRPLADRVTFVCNLAMHWAKLRETPVPQRRAALVLSNYPHQNGRIGNGVGLDTPASTMTILHAMQAAGYDIRGLPADAAALMTQITSGVTNHQSSRTAASAATLSLADYQRYFAHISDDAAAQMTQRWGTPEKDPFFRNGHFHLPIHIFGHVAVAVQPARGYHIDPKSSYHDPALPPPHGYLAFHLWLEHHFGAQALVHVGKHGNLEWLPGKAVSLSNACFPEICAGTLPQIYPFIVNDPGEGTQAKRRISATIIDHLTPPLTRAESYGPLKQLEALVDEYYLAAGMDPRRIDKLKSDILALAALSGMDRDLGLPTSAASTDQNDDDILAAIDNYLCELKELQIRDGLHIFGRSPTDQLRRDLLIALARTPRGRGKDGDASLLRAMADDLLLGFDPLDCDFAQAWTGPRPACLADISTDPWRSTGDTVERLEYLAMALVVPTPPTPPSPPPLGPATHAVLTSMTQDLGPRIDACGAAEISALLAALNGDFIPPGPSGAPTRGRPDVLPTGRNFYSVDPRAIPTPTAWDLGFRSAQLLVDDYLQRSGDYPTAIAMSAWGTANMRTGGDDIAQALALMGARPLWDYGSGRVTGFEILKLAHLGRPRVDVTFRTSGFFRDAFPDQINLLDSAARAIMQLDEDVADNPAADRYRREQAQLVTDGHSADAASHFAGARVFGSAPGSYGAGLQALIDEKCWTDRSDLAENYLRWGGFIYGNGASGDAGQDHLKRRLKSIDAIVQNQDNREHDLLDSDDYYQFEGGLSAAVEWVQGHAPLAYHNDHSRPERPRIRTLQDEISLIVRGRLTNPKWIAGVMRHGYKGAFEIAASIDYLFAFRAATNAVQDHHFDAVYAAFIDDPMLLDFLKNANPHALSEIAARLSEAIERGLWKPRSNSAAITLLDLAGQKI
ncbi:cobaltochelatase subunit CobN [Sphingopyxis yananensis]|uniref:cobaltochelatase subunit CobN n=1 Tax=Sphingopyxis yananensis TaxID=2886687 RepID=UPI001D102647|nr:cobaltochelatase subunit CobN [Sphingopyxis yananensis]MCC2603600.1 cobaltochelatase subunit CobN [Sphingopyxis yananensis]